MAKADPKAERAAKLAEALRAAREQNTYPLTAARLREVADPEASDNDLFAALSHESLAVAAKKDLSSPVVLSEDAESFAVGDALLEFALGKLVSAEKPLQPVAKIVGKVEKALQPAFEASLNDRLASNRFPASVGRQDAKETPHLFLTKFPPPPPKVFPAVELAKQLVAAVEPRFQQGERIVSLSEVCPADTDPGVLKKALTESLFTDKVTSVPVSKSLTLLAPAGERDAILTGDRLLCGLLGSRTTTKKPLATPADLAAALPEGDRETFLRTLADRMQAKTLPAGVIMRDGEGQQVLCLQSNLAATLLLSESVLAGLRRRRESNTDYPVRLNALVQAEAPGTSPELVEQLAADKNFRAQALFAFPGRVDSPIGVAGDEERLANSRLVLESAVGLLSTAEEPLHPLKKIAGRLDGALRASFEQSVQKLIEENSLPATLALHDVKGQPHLRRADYPLPPPADEALAGRLVTALKQARHEGNYPVPIRELVQQVNPHATEKATKAGLAHHAFRAQAIVSVPNDLDSPAALVEDRARLASEPRVLEYAMTRARSDDNTALPIPDVCKLLTLDLRPEFTASVGRWLASASLPTKVGCLLVKKKPYLFLKTDLTARPITVPVATAVDTPAKEEESVPVRDNFEAEMSKLHAKEDAEEAPAPVEQGDLFASVNE